MSVSVISFILELVLVNHYETVVRSHLCDISVYVLGNIQSTARVIQSAASIFKVLHRIFKVLQEQIKVLQV